MSAYYSYVLVYCVLAMLQLIYNFHRTILHLSSFCLLLLHNLLNWRKAKLVRISSWNTYQTRRVNVRIRCTYLKQKFCKHRSFIRFYAVIKRRLKLNHKNSKNSLFFLIFIQNRLCYCNPTDHKRNIIFKIKFHIQKGT